MGSGVAGGGGGGNSCGAGAGYASVMGACAAWGSTISPSSGDDGVAGGMGGGECSLTGRVPTALAYQYAKEDSGSLTSSLNYSRALCCTSSKPALNGAGPLGSSLPGSVIH